MPNERRGFSRRPRLNPEAEWIIRDEPQLRIIDQFLWDRVKVRQAEARSTRDAKFKLTGNPLAGTKRPAHLLTDLVTCGTCGAPFLATVAARATAQERATRAQSQPSSWKRVRSGGIRERLLTLPLIKRCAALLQQELAVAARAGNAERAQVEHDLAETRARIAKLVTHIEEDEDAPRALTTRVKDLEAEERRLEEVIAGTPASQVIRLPTKYESLYTRAIAKLDAHLASDNGASARQVIRPLIEKIVVQPGSARGGKRVPTSCMVTCTGCWRSWRKCVRQTYKSPRPEGLRLL